VILIDANLLIYAYDSSSRQHAAARPWLETALSGDEPVRLPLVVLTAFVRLTTDARVMARPLSVADASAIVESWLALPAVAVASPTQRHWSLLADLATSGQARGPLVMDAHVAALAIEHGATLCTTDRDFSRFAGLRWRDPLTA
jgi:toxin-antitoxin system PIN domain toxin